jgi:hypothetical protein
MGIVRRIDPDEVVERSNLSGNESAVDLVTASLAN